MKDLVVDLLPDEEAVRTVASWQWQEWGAGYPDMTLDGFVTEVRKALRSATIPIVLVARVGVEVIGTASIILNDLPTRQDLKPWLASVFVLPEYRNSGIGTSLTREAIKHAKILKLRSLYLFTHDKTAFYKKFGWREVDRAVFMGEDVDIMILNII